MNSRTRSRRPASIGSNQSSRTWITVSASDCRAKDFVLLLVMAWSPPDARTSGSFGFQHPETTPPSIPTTPRTAPGRLAIPGFVEAVGEPIRNPVTGAEHRARIDLPDGFAFRIAEMGSGTTQATGAIKLDLRDAHAHFAHVHLNNKGVVD